MILRLSDSLSRALVVLTAVLVSVWLSFFSVRAAMARYGAEGRTKRRLQSAARLEPDNPTYWYSLARFHQYDLEQPDPELAKRFYRKAIELDPLYTDAWMDLGTAYELEGQDEQARQALQQAKKSYPISADVSWRYGNFLLRQGDRTAAYAELKRAISADPRRAAAAFSRAYRANPNMDEILAQLLPADQNVYLSVIQEAADSKQLAVAQTIWAELMKLHPKLTFQDVNHLVLPLMQDKEYLEARRIWDEGVANINLPPLFQLRLSVVWDPSFESGINGSAYSWRFQPLTQGVNIVFDKSEQATGQRSLRFSFDGKHNPNQDLACTYANVQPGTNYQFSGWIKTKDVTTENGLEFRIGAPGNSRVTVGSTREVHGTNPWTVIEQKWSSPSDVHEVQVCVAREPSDNPDVRISGTAWVDDVNLVPEATGNHKP
jgi:tetratricopeptide (TPR) repeat protein